VGFVGAGGEEADEKAERKKGGGGKRIRIRQLLTRHKCRARDRFHPLHTTERSE
jgi:hypothetical protein